MLSSCVVWLEPEERAVPLVQHAAVGRGEDLPGDRAEEGRRHERRRHEEAHQAMRRACRFGPPAKRAAWRRRRQRPETPSAMPMVERNGPMKPRVGGQPREIRQCRRARLVGEAYHSSQPSGSSTSTQSTSASTARPAPTHRGACGAASRRRSRCCSRRSRRRTPTRPSPSRGGKCPAAVDEIPLPP